MNRINRDKYNQEDWENIIYNELAEGRPVLYSGTSYNGSHVFIVDGYNRGLFHINWGWGGLSNFYFVLSAADPDKPGINGASSYNGYRYYQDALIGVEPFCEPYATLSDDSLTVTFYYDGYMKSRNGMAIGDYFGLYGKEQTYTNATIAVFDDSFADYYPSVTGYWFAGCNNLKEIKGISNLKTDSVTEMADMFYGCSNLTSLDLSGFNTDNVKDMEYMFHGCSSLASIDLSGFKTDSVTNMVYMFNSCSRLSTIYAGDGWSTSNVENSVGMFSGCRNLIGGQGTKFNSSYTDHTYARIDGGVEAPGYFTSKENTGIRNVNSGGALAVELIYDVKGVKHNSYRKGLNIIHMNGGMTKKLIVK